jgi:hypothetical protein
LTTKDAFALWLTAPAPPFNVKFTLAVGAVAAAVNVIACCPPDATLNCAGEALTPVGNPLTLTLTEAAVPLTLTVRLPDEPGVSTTIAGCTVMAKSTLPPPPVEEPPPPQPVRVVMMKTKRKAIGILKLDSARLVI